MNDRKSAAKPAGPMQAVPPIYMSGAQSGAKVQAYWQRILIIFMRSVALLWILQGVLLWRLMIVPEPSVLEGLSLTGANIFVGFAVLDVVAATGLWMVTPWGGILWVITCLAQIASVVYGAAPLPLPTLQGLACGVLLGAYLFITYRAGIEQNQRRV